MHFEIVSRLFKLIKISSDIIVFLTNNINGDFSESSFPDNAEGLCVRREEDKTQMTTQHIKFFLRTYDIFIDAIVQSSNLPS